MMAQYSLLGYTVGNRLLRALQSRRYDIVHVVIMALLTRVDEMKDFCVKTRSLRAHPVLQQ